MTRRVDLTDPDNPEWTPADFARGVGPERLSDAELAAFPLTRSAAVRGLPSQAGGLPAPKPAVIRHVRDIAGRLGSTRCWKRQITRQ